jgi:hypothetical protein
MAGALKLIAIAFTPIALMGLVISKQAISGDQYAAVLEVFGNASRPGAIEVFGADIQTVSSLLDFFGAWSLPALVVIALLATSALALSNDRLRSSFHFCLGLFFSFGLWVIFLTQSNQRFSSYIGSAISDFSALVIAKYLSELSAELLNLIGLLTLVFGLLSIGLWLLLTRRKTSDSQTLN